MNEKPEAPSTLDCEPAYIDPMNPYGHNPVDEFEDVHVEWREL